MLFFAALLVPAPAAQAGSTVLCSGYSSCTAKGYSNFGYSSNQGKSYWRMYTGANCTNYVAYRLITTNKMSTTRPKPGVGNAEDWGIAMASITNKTPAVGSVAWWNKGHHVAYVEKIISPTEILVSESHWQGTFDWRTITKSGSGWPDGFIHFKDPVLKNTATPTIVGTVKVGGSLTAGVGGWSPVGTSYAYQWYAGSKAISGASQKKFAPTAAQLGSALTVRVSASRTSYPGASAVSKASVVQAGSLSASKPPTIAGTPRVDTLLTAAPGTWTPTGATHTYQWLADGKAISGAASATFRPGGAQFGKRISVSVTASKSGYTPVKSASASTAAVAPGALANTSKPAIAGKHRVGVTLIAQPGTWSRSGLTYAYTWFADGKPVPGATRSTYLLPAGDRGRRMTVTVTASKAGYTTAHATSGATTPIAYGLFRSASRPVVTGHTRVGSRLATSTGSWSPTGTYSYEWSADGKVIPKATARTFVLTTRQRGHKIRVRVLVRKPGFTVAGATSTNTKVVTSGRISLSKTPTITGSLKKGSLLTLNTGVPTPKGAKLRYQWMRNGKPLSGATGKTHRVRTADRGKKLSVRVKASATGYSTLVVTTRARRAG